MWVCVEGYTKKLQTRYNICKFHNYYYEMFFDFSLVLKGKSSLMMFDKHANLKYKFGNRHFWAEGYYVSTVGLNEDTIKKYIQD